MNGAIGRQRDVLLRELERLAEMEEILERFGEDDWEEGSVVTFERSFPRPGPGGQTTYSYAAIKAGGLWWMTGKTSFGMPWEGLVRTHLVHASEVCRVAVVEEV